MSAHLSPALFTEKIQHPATFSISAPKDACDFTLHARTFAVEIKFAYKINHLVRGTGGREVLSGWCESATSKATVFVHNPANEEAAMRAVREMVRELNSTLRLFIETPEHIRPIITGIPIGFRLVGTPRLVNRAQPRKVGYVSDMIDATKDAWARTLAAFELDCAEHAEEVAE